MSRADCFKSYTLFDTNLTVPEWQETKPELSDIVLAYGSEAVSGEPQYRPFRFGNVEVFPNPRAVYSIGDDLVGAVEPRNAPAGSRLRFEVVSQEPSPQTPVEKTVSVESLSGGAMVQALSLANVAGGRFELVVTLLDSAGAVLDRRASGFTVSPRTSIVRPGVRGTISPPRPEVPGVVAMLLGGQYLRKDEKGKARVELSRALRENPRLGPAREQLARLYLEAGEVDEVFTVLEPLVRDAPDRFEVLVPLGHAYFQKKQYAESIATFEKAIALKRPDPALLNVLAQAYHEIGNDARAQEMLERSLSLNPDQAPVKELLERLKAGTNSPR